VEVISMSPRVLVFLVALLNLAAGLGAGFAAGRASVERHSVGAIPEPEVDLPALTDSLALPPEKNARVRAILASCRPRLEAVMGEFRPKMRALHEKFLGELSAELDQAQIDRLIVEYHKRAGLPH
jgi:hypothetical protein